MKGLGSSRKAARQGFATALVHVLYNLSTDITLQNIFDLISEHLEVRGNYKCQVGVKNGLSRFCFRIFMFIKCFDN